MVYAKLRIIVLGSHGQVPESENHEDAVFSDLGKMNPQRYWPTMKQNSSMEPVG